MRNRNLLEETLLALKQNGKTPKDVSWCGSLDAWFSWSEFAELAAKTNYDSRFGGQEIAPDLAIVGDNWWLERGKYDRSEWWEFKSLPRIPSQHIMPVRLVTYGESLAEYQKSTNE